MWEFFVTSLLLMCACVLAAAGPCPEWTETAMQPKAHPDNPSASRYQCEARAGVGGVPDQCCCGPLMNGTWHCLPRVIIAGAQKSGSTALYGYLTLHPNFSPARRKELHAFEAASRWRDKPVALMSYLLSFQAHDPAKITGEATPSYILGYGTAQTLASILPDVKLIITLRHPVDRMYSEYHMKLRRVTRQVDVLGRDHDEIRSIHKSCLARAETVAGSESPSVWQSCLEGSLASVPAFLVQVFNRKATLQRFSTCITRVRGLGPVLPTFHDIVQCFQAPTLNFETVGTLDEVLQTEIASIRRCEATDPPADVTLLDGRVVPGPRLQWGTSTCFPMGTSSAISKDYVMRGMYYAQLVRMLQFVDKDNLLILEDNELREKPEETMSRVWDFIGLAPFNVSGITNDDVYKRFSELYPTFEATTGWMMESDYPPMPAAARSKLLDLYKPHNEQLFQLLGRRFNWTR